MAESCDVVVAGAGHNSLVAACYLAKAGFEVCVLEARDVIGGDTASEELNLPGFLHDTCSTFQPSLMGSPVLRDDELGLVADYGLELIRPEVGVHMPFPDGASITQYLDPQRTRESIAELSRRDADAYLRLFEEWEAVKGIFGRAANTPVGFGPPLDEQLDPRWRRRAAMSAWDVVRHEFEDEHVRSFMAWMAQQTLQPVQRPGTGQLAYSVFANRQRHGWAVFRGGTGQLPAACERLLLDHGGTVLAGRRVTGLVLEGGRCAGVETEDGERFLARHAVLSTIHVKHLVGMAPREAWDDDFLDAVELWQGGGTLFVTYLATSVPLPWPALGPGVPAARILQVAADWDAGRVNVEDPPLLAACTSIVDPSRAPEGRHVVKILGMQPYALAEGDWDELKDEVADAHVAQVRRYAPGLTDDAILARTVKSPLDLERTNAHNWHGSCHGGDGAPAQSGRLRFQPRTPIPGLYQTGATTYPGGSVTAAPGRNAAQVLLRDLGRDWPA